MDTPSDASPAQNSPADGRGITDQHGELPRDPAQIIRGMRKAVTLVG
jgi:hypothetical protein